MPANPEKQSDGEPSPSEARSATRRTVVFARAKATAAPPAQALLPATTLPVATPSGEREVPSHQFEPIGAGAVTGPADEWTASASIDAAGQATSEGATPPVIQRRAHPKRHAEVDKGPKGKRNKLREILEKLAEDDDDDEDNRIEGQPAKVLQAKRLPKTGTTSDGNPSALRPRPDQPPEANPTGDAPIYTLPRSRNDGKWSLPLAWTCTLLLGLSAYLWLKKPHDDHVAADEEQVTAAARAPIPANVSDHALELVKNALTAQKSGDFKTAAALYQQARNEKLVLPGLNYQSASLALEAGDYDAAFSFVNRCIAANENVPQCLYLRANAVALDGDFSAAAENFAQAVRVTPFSARNYFFLAECLRRKGNFPAALEQFKQALLRRPSRAEAELIAFRMNLARIEMNGDDGIQKQINEHLASANPSGDTLLLATAAELSRGNYPAAAEYLRRCLSTLPQPVLDSRLNDYFFRLHLQQPQVAAVLDVAKTPGPTGLLGSTSTAYTRPSLVNLADRSLAEADPASWP